jgi:hypothetical protein
MLKFKKNITGIKMDNLEEALNTANQLGKTLSASALDSINKNYIPLKLPNIYFDSIIGIAGTMAKATNQIFQDATAGMNLGKGILSMLNYPNIPDINTSVTSLLGSYPDITQLNSLLQMANPCGISSQILGSKSLSSIADSVNYPNLSSFRDVEYALQGFTKDLFNDLIITDNSIDIDVRIESNSIISSVSEEYFTNNNQISIDLLSDYKDALLLKFNELYLKISNSDVRKSIAKLVATIVTIITLLTAYMQLSDISNKEVLQGTNNHTDYSNNIQTNKIISEYHKLQSRVAIKNVDLRYYPKENSQYLGKVKQEQIVTVIQIRHKYLWICYLDQETGRPMTGFVLKKYFEIGK